MNRIKFLVINILFMFFSLSCNLPELKEPMIFLMEGIIFRSMLNPNNLPISLSFSGSPYVLTVGENVNIVPESTGSIHNCSSDPELPAGLSLSQNCIITGAPNATTAAANYTITASNSFGQTSTTISIEVEANPPSNLNYAGTPYTFTISTPIATLTPTYTGTVASFSVAPALPAGLNLNTSTGAITGTPGALQGTQSYTITATNLAGSTDFTITITINDSTASDYVVVGYNDDSTQAIIARFNGETDATVWTTNGAIPTTNKRFGGLAIGNDNSIFVGGLQGADLTNTNTIIKKYDFDGNEIVTNWNKVFTGDTGYNFAYSLAVDLSTNDLYTGEYTFSSRQWRLRKFDTNGAQDTTNWNKTFGFDSPSIPDLLHDVYVYNNKLYAFGSNDSNGSSTATRNNWRAKIFDLSGNELNDVTFPSPAGGCWHNVPYSFTADNNDFYIGGTINTQSPCDDLAWRIIKTDEDLNTIWTFVDNITPNATTVANRLEIVHTMVYHDGYIYAGGTVAQSAGGNFYSIGLKKINATTGVEVTTGWNKMIDTGFARHDIVYASVVPKNGEIVFIVSKAVSASSARWFIQRYATDGTLIREVDTGIEGIPFNARLLP